MKRQKGLRLDEATEKLAEEGRRRRGSRSLNAYLVELIQEDAGGQGGGPVSAKHQRLEKETERREKGNAGATEKAEAKRAVSGDAGRGRRGSRKGAVRKNAEGEAAAVREPAGEGEGVLLGPSERGPAAGVSLPPDGSRSDPGRADGEPVIEQAEEYRLETTSGAAIEGIPVEGGPLKASPASARINAAVEPIAFRCRTHRALWCEKTECVTEKQENEGRGVRYLR